MPFKHAEDRRRYDRERKRRLRAVSLASPAEVVPDRVEVAEGLQALLAEAVARVRRDPKAREIDKGREIGRLVAVALRLPETRDLAERLEAMERVLQPRRVG